MRILVVEDELHLSEALSHILKKNNYTVDVANDGETGLDDALSGIYDVIVLDTPVILLTAKNEISDKVLGLDSGADDYLAKPFNTEELLARIRALGRRRGEIVSNTNTISYGDITLNTSSLKLTAGASEITLTLKESELLEHLMLHKEMVCSKEQIIEKLWGFDSEAESNHVEVYISFLRKKLAFVHSKVSINTVRGVGYTLSE